MTPRSLLKYGNGNKNPKAQMHAVKVSEEQAVRCNAEGRVWGLYYLASGLNNRRRFLGVTTEGGSESLARVAL